EESGDWCPRVWIKSGQVPSQVSAQGQPQVGQDVPPWEGERQLGQPVDQVPSVTAANATANPGTDPLNQLRFEITFLRTRIKDLDMKVIRLEDESAAKDYQQPEVDRRIKAIEAD